MRSRGGPSRGRSVCRYERTRGERRNERADEATNTIPLGRYENLYSCRRFSSHAPRVGAPLRAPRASARARGAVASRPLHGGVMAPSFTSPKQALEQGVCGQHGWSSRYFRDPATGCWCVEVRWGVGPDAGRVFASEDASEDTKPGAKRGHAAAATVALAGLADVLAVANAKPAVTIEAAFGPRFDATCRVVPTWSAFWALCASAAPPPSSRSTWRGTSGRRRFSCRRAPGATRGRT